MIQDPVSSPARQPLAPVSHEELEHTRNALVRLMAQLPLEEARLLYGSITQTHRWLPRRAFANWMASPQRRRMAQDLRCRLSGKHLELMGAALLSVAIQTCAGANESHERRGHRAGHSSSGAITKVNVSNPPAVPAIAGPVPKGYVPTFSLYGQLDADQQGVYGAQLSIPLAF